MTSKPPENAQHCAPAAVHQNEAAALHPGPFGLLSDAHGNPLGLRIAIDALRDAGASTLFFLGDAVGYLPYAQEVLATLSDEGIVCLRGNHEAMLLGELPLAPERDLVYRIGETRRALSAGDMDFVASWPLRLLVADAAAPNTSMLLVHGSPDDPLRGYVYPDSDHSFLDRLNATALACGHTHRAFQARRDGKLLLNCGSVGLPRDHGALASCALVDLPGGTCEILRRLFDASRLIRPADAQLIPHPDVVAVLRRSPAANVDNG